MKIIEALKKIKDLQKKADDLRAKVGNNCAYQSFENPTYPDQRSQVGEWIQAHSDILKEIMRLRFAIQKTNIGTEVVIELSEKNVTKTIAEWIHRRRDLAGLERDIWRKLTDRGLKEGQGMNTLGQPVTISIVRCFDPKERDKKVSDFDSEPSQIDAKLEIINAVTDLME